MLTQELKETIHQHCIGLLEKKLLAIRASLVEATEAGNTETKSSAGDKHETSRAMMQLEQEKLSRHYNEINNQLSELLNTTIKTTIEKVTKGSLIKTENGLFFLAVGIGKIQLDTHTVFVINYNSPLGLALQNLKLNEFISVNGLKYSIHAIQ